MDAIDTKKGHGKKIFDGAVEKVARYYVPPVALVEDISADQAGWITLQEQIANLSYIQPSDSIFYELNCSERMYRELNYSMRQDGKRISRDRPSEWKYLPPEGNLATLLKIVCPPRSR
jgi:hypothetical protein